MSLREQFDRDGYVLVPNAIPVAQALSIRARFLPKFLDGKTSTVEDTVVNDAEIRSLIAGGPLHDALREVLGTPFVAPPYSSVDYGRFVSFHTDTTGIEMDGARFQYEPDFRMVTVGIYLQQHQVGGLDVVPGSQRKPDPYMAKRIVKNEARARIKGSLWRRWANRLSRGRLFDVNKPFLTAPGSITPPMKLGDGIIFNLKVFHAGNRDPVPDGHKLAIFYKCGAKNTGTDAYAENVHGNKANAYLRDPARAAKVAALNTAAAGMEFR